MKVRDTNLKLPFIFLKERKPEIDALMMAEIQIETTSQIPDTKDIPLEGVKWLQSPAITCVYIDLVKSTHLQVIKHPKTTAKVYQLFVENMVRALNNFDAQFIDVRGDGGFGIFVGEDSPVAALCAAITFKTLCSKYLENSLPEFKIQAHIGIDKKAVLFKQVGMRGDKKNVVWAGKPVNMSAKLASLAAGGQVAISDRVYEVLSKPKFKKYAVMSCGCSNGKYTGETSNLWTAQSVTDKGYFDFTTAYVNPAIWCDTHGDDFCKNLMQDSTKESVVNRITADILRSLNL